jgi:hypothetical protein
MLISVVYGLAKATGGEKLLADEPGGVFRRQKDSDGGDVARLADAAERSLRDGGLLEIRSDDADERSTGEAVEIGIRYRHVTLQKYPLAGARLPLACQSQFPPRTEVG